MESPDAIRKNEHLALAEKLYPQTHQTNPFKQVQIIPTDLPETAVDQTSLQTTITDELQLERPFYLEAMTGGSKRAGQINADLAAVAHKYQLAMATGSMSIIFKDPASQSSFQVIRKQNPDGIVLANLSAKASIDQAAKAMQLVHAQALEIHLNAAQELVMPEGGRQFNWVANIDQLAARFPVIVKEVGFGMNKNDISQLQSAGVTVINVSGRGGTNFAAIENARNYHTDLSSLTNWGLTTPQSLLEARASRHPSTAIIASGGICSPLDVVKAGVLGADAVGVAGHFLHQYIQHGRPALEKTIADWTVAVERLITLCGCHNFQELRTCQFTLSADLLAYAQQRQII